MNINTEEKAIQLLDDFRWMPPLKYFRIGNPVTAINPSMKWPVNAQIVKVMILTKIALKRFCSAYFSTAIEEASLTLLCM